MQLKNTGKILYQKLQLVKYKKLYEGQKVSCYFFFENVFFNLGILVILALDKGKTVTSSDLALVASFTGNATSSLCTFQQQSITTESL